MTRSSAGAAQKARVGQLADLSDSQEYDDLMARERSVISGRTDVEFTGLLTVTTPRPRLSTLLLPRSRVPPRRRAAKSGLCMDARCRASSRPLFLSGGRHSDGRQSDPGPSAPKAPAEERRDGDQPPRIASSLPLESGTRVYGAAGWSPPRSDRGARRSARQVELEYRKRLMDQRRAEIEALRQEKRERPFLARGGEPGPMAGRSYRRLRLVPHRATSEVLAVPTPSSQRRGSVRRV